MSKNKGKETNETKNYTFSAYLADGQGYGAFYKEGASVAPKKVFLAGVVRRSATVFCSYRQYSMAPLCLYNYNIRQVIISMSDKVEPERGYLAPGEPHPSAYHARDYIAHMSKKNLAMWREAFASCAIEGNRLGEICNYTLERLQNGETVSDRYIMGLAFAMIDKRWLQATFNEVEEGKN